MLRRSPTLELTRLNEEKSKNRLSNSASLGCRRVWRNGSSGMRDAQKMRNGHRSVEDLWPVEFTTGIVPHFRCSSFLRKSPFHTPAASHAPAACPPRRKLAAAGGGGFAYPAKGETMESPAVRPGRVAAARPRSFVSAPHPRPWVHPRFRKLPPPVIVMGMHRSGTSLVAGLLSRLGVYMGPKVQLPKDGGPIQDAILVRSGYGEAEELVYLNDDLLRSAGAAWDNPQPFLDLWDDESFMRRCAARLQRATAGSLYWDYLAAMPRGSMGAWGWKDPRNTLTLPCWLALFPEATVIHVRRDPTAAAASLHRRALEDPPPPGPALAPRERVRWWLRRPDEALRRLGCKLRLTSPAPPRPEPCRDAAYCDELTRVYVNAARRNHASGHQSLELWYEEVVSDPLRATRALAERVACHVPDAQIRAAAALVGSRR